jgi:hypothetical protein
MHVHGESVVVAVQLFCGFFGITHLLGAIWFADQALFLLVGGVAFLLMAGIGQWKNRIPQLAACVIALAPLAVHTWLSLRAWPAVGMVDALPKLMVATGAALAWLYVGRNPAGS